MHVHILRTFLRSGQYDCLHSIGTSSHALNLFFCFLDGGAATRPVNAAVNAIGTRRPLIRQSCLGTVHLFRGADGNRTHPDCYLCMHERESACRPRTALPWPSGALPSARNRASLTSNALVSPPINGCRVLPVVRSRDRETPTACSPTRRGTRKPRIYPAPRSWRVPPSHLQIPVRSLILCTPIHMCTYLLRTYTRH